MQYTWKYVQETYTFMTVKLNENIQVLNDISCDKNSTLLKSLNFYLRLI